MVLELLMNVTALLLLPLSLAVFVDIAAFYIQLPSTLASASAVAADLFLLASWHDAA